MILDKLFKNEKGEFIDVIDVIMGKSSVKDYIYTIAEAHAIDLIAKMIAKTEIQTYELDKNEKIKENKGELYWRLNLQPNFNENGTMFIYKLITKLLTNEKALIIINKVGNKEELFYIADSFEASDDILYGKKFNNVKISDNEGNSLNLAKSYTQENSIYYSIQNQNLSKAKESFKLNAGKLLETISKKYIKSNTAKWRFKRPGQQLPLKDLATGEDLTYEQYLKKITKGLLSDEESVIMLADMFDLINLNKDNNQSLADYKDMFKQISDTVANTWNIPLDIFYGSKTEKSTGNDDFITFAIEPFFELLEDGFNIALVGKKAYLKGEYVMFNRLTMQHKDIIDSANGIDKLTGDGFSRNEINKFLRLPRIDEPWADEHNITKNYGKMKGGAKEDGE